MINYGWDSITSHFGATDFNSLGVVTLERLEGRVPFYQFTIKAKPLRRFDEKLCGGKCIDLMTKHFYMILT